MVDRSSLGGLFQSMALPEASALTRCRAHDMISTCSLVQPLGVRRSSPPSPLHQPPAPPPLASTNPHPPPISPSLIPLPIPAPSPRHLLAHPPHSLALPPLRSSLPSPLPSRSTPPTEAGRVSVAPPAPPDDGPPRMGVPRVQLVRVVFVLYCSSARLRYALGCVG